mmetsp:Transcript_20284/g.77641  ORF Transcript_20284/g.77641 Transcript_20284/m.77641 type:complete len:656 (-) Transcript_20284:27-1994(-)
MSVPLLEEQLGWGTTKRHVRFVQELRRTLGFVGNVCPKSLLVADIDGDGSNEVAVASTGGELLLWRRLGCERAGDGESMEGENEKGRESERRDERAGEIERLRESEKARESERARDTQRDTESDSDTLGIRLSSERDNPTVRSSLGLHSFPLDADSPEEEWRICRCSGLGTVTSLAVGDVRNCGRPSLVACSAEGQCFIFDLDARYLSATPDAAVGEWQLAPADQAEIPVNASVAVMWDVDGRGGTDLIIGTTDRKVQALRLRMDSRSGELRFMQRGCWQLKEQVVSLCPCDQYVVGTNSRPQRVIIAGLQGGYFAVVSNYTGISGVVYRQGASLPHQSAGVGDPMQDLLALGGHQPRPKAVQGTNSNLTEVVVCKTRSRYKRELHVVCANLGGNVVAQGMDGSAVWEKALGRPIFALHSLDVTGDGNDEVVVTSVDGITHIIDCKTGDSVTHKLRLPLHHFHGISASVAAILDGPDGTTMPCLLYISFGGELIAYLDTSLESVSPFPVSLLLKDRLRNGDDGAADPLDGGCGSGGSNARLRAALYESHLAEAEMEAKEQTLARVREERARLLRMLHERRTQSYSSAEDVSKSSSAPVPLMSPEDNPLDDTIEDTDEEDEEEGEFEEGEGEGVVLADLTIESLAAGEEAEEAGRL